MQDLPDFEFDHENKTAWGFVEVDNVEYNVSCPYDLGTLQDWDNTVPQGCNFGIIITLYKEHPHSHSHKWALENLVIPIAKKIADEFQVVVHHHRTWLGIGRNVERNLVFIPNAG